jgi:hypothetical protein
MTDTTPEPVVDDLMRCPVCGDADHAEGRMSQGQLMVDFPWGPGPIVCVPCAVQIADLVEANVVPWRRDRARRLDAGR